MAIPEGLLLGWHFTKDNSKEAHELEWFTKHANSEA